MQGLVAITVSVRVFGAVATWLSFDGRNSADRGIIHRMGVIFLAIHGAPNLTVKRGTQVLTTSEAFERP